MDSAPLEGRKVSPDVQHLYDDAVAKIKAVGEATPETFAAARDAAQKAIDDYNEARKKPLGGRRRKTRGRKHGRKTRRRHS